MTDGELAIGAVNGQAWWKVMVRREFAGWCAGRLVVAPGKLELRTGSVTGRLSHLDGVEHAGSRLTRFYTARLRLRYPGFLATGNGVAATGMMAPLAEQNVKSF